MSGRLFRRCGCRTETGKSYGTLPERASDTQRSKACPKMLRDPKHGSWSFRVSQQTPEGRKLYNGGAFPTMTAAREARTRVESRIDSGATVVRTMEKYHVYLVKWLERRKRTGTGLAATTVENYARYIAQDISPSRLGAMSLEDIRRNHINSFIDELVAAGRGATTVRRIVAVIQGSLRDAAKEDLIPMNPANNLALPIVHKEPFKPWEPEQVGLFLDVAAQHRLGALYEVAVFTGLRRGELCGLRWADVNFDASTLRVTQNVTDAGGVGATKTVASLRTVHLDDRARGALLGMQMSQTMEATEWGAAWTNTGFVFTNEAGLGLKPGYVTRLFNTLRDAAGLPEMTFHGLRHEHASLLLAANVPLAVVSKRLGHSSITVTSDTYSHLIGNAGHDAANAASALVPVMRRVL